MGCHFLLQGLFPTQGLNQYLLCLPPQLDSSPYLPQLEKVYSNKDPGQSKVTLKKGRQKEEEIGGREKSERSSSALGRVINNGFVWEGELTVHLLGMPVEESGQETGQPPKDRGPTTATAGALTHSPSHLVLALPFPLFLFPSFRPML